MKSASANLAAHTGQEVLSLATLARIVRRHDGAVYRFTDHDRDLVVDVGFGDESFLAAAGYRRSTVASSDALAADDMELEIVLSDQGLIESELLAGLFDDAAVTLFAVNHQAPEDGAMILFKGTVARVEAGEGRATLQLRDLRQYLEVTVGEQISAACNRDLGDARCRAVLDPPIWQAETAYAARHPRDAAANAPDIDTVKGSDPELRVRFRCVVGGTSDVAEPAWDTGIGNQTVDGSVTWEAEPALQLTGTVGSAADPRSFADTGLVEADGYWDEGWVRFLTTPDLELPNNTGLVREIQTYLQTGGAVVLRLDLPYPIRVGDTYQITKGCNKGSDCQAVFGNILNQRGWGQFLPGLETAARTPDARL